MKAIKPRTAWQARSKVAVRLHRQRTRLAALRKCRTADKEVTG